MNKKIKLSSHQKKWFDWFLKKLSVSDLENKINESFLDENPSLIDDIPIKKDEYYDIMNIESHKEFVTRFFNNEILLNLGRGADYSILYIKIYGNKIEYIKFILLRYIWPLLISLGIILTAYYFQNWYILIALSGYLVASMVTSMVTLNTYNGNGCGLIFMWSAIGVLVYFIIKDNYEYLVFPISYILFHYTTIVMRINYRRILQKASLASEIALILLLMSRQLEIIIQE